MSINFFSNWKFSITHLFSHWTKQLIFFGSQFLVTAWKCFWSPPKKHFNHYLKIFNHPINSGSISRIDLMTKIFPLLTQINLVTIRKIQSPISYEQIKWFKKICHQIKWQKILVATRKFLAIIGLRQMGIAFVTTWFKATKWSNFQLPLILVRKH
jgi:hypothetical protein